jgi:TP901 family phage tail tape measure protein
MDDLAGVTASLSQNMGIAGNKIGYTLDILAVQGKRGAVELKDLAMLLPTASAGFKKFGEKGERGVAVLGAALQVTKTATGTASEAATAFNALGRALTANATRIKKASGGKVKVFEIDPKTKRKVARDFVDILRDLRSSKLGQDQEKLQKALGTDEALKSFQAISDNWDEFQQQIAGGLSGGGTIAADFDKYLASPAGRIERAWTRASNALQAAVTPERVEKIAEATEAFARALGFVVDHAAHMVALIGAVKLAQLAMATNKWATAMSGVASSATQVSGAIGRGSAGLSTMASGTNRLVGGLGRAASHAEGMLAAFTASYTATSMLVDALGLFQDEHRAMATPDDPQARAAFARENREQAEKERNKFAKQVADYQAQIARARGPGNATWQTPAAIARKEEKLREAQAQLRLQESQFASLRAEELGLTIFERGQARGTEAPAHVLAQLKNQQVQDALSRLGTGFAEHAPAVDSEVLRNFGSEAQGLHGAGLADVIGVLERLLAEQQKTRELQEKVANKPNFEAMGGNVPVPAVAPRSGTTPR